MQIETNKRTINTPTILFIISFVFSFYYIDIGFALKPFMILSIVLFIIFIKSFKIHKLILFEVFLLIFFLYFCATGLFAKYPNYSIRLILGVCIIIFCYFVMRYIFSLSNINGIEKGLSISGIIFNVLSLILYFIGLLSLNFVLVGNQIKSFGVLMDRNFPRLIGMASDPNLYCVYNLLFFYFYLTHLNRKWSKLGLILSILTIMLTLSRSGIIAILIGLVFYFFFSNTRQKVKILFIIPLALAVLGFISNKVFNINVLQLISNRFKTFDGGSGRLEIWEAGIYIFKKHPEGIGIFNYRPVAENIIGKAIFMHNTFLEVLIEGGIIGFALYIIIFIIISVTYIKVRKTIKDNGFLFFTFISMVVLMATLSMIINEMFFLLLALFWRYIYESRSEERRHNLK